MNTIYKQSLVTIWHPTKPTLYVTSSDTYILTDKKEDAAVFPSKGMARKVGRKIAKGVFSPAKVKVKKLIVDE